MECNGFGGRRGTSRFLCILWLRILQSFISSHKYHIVLTHHKAILRLGIPIAIGQLGVIIMGFADTMMVGRYSTDALAAASICLNSVMNLITFLLMGYSYGLTPLVSSLFGQGKRQEAGGVLKQALACNLLFALFLMAIMATGYFFLDRMGQPSQLLPLIAFLLSGDVGFPLLCSSVQCVAPVY